MKPSSNPQDSGRIPVHCNRGCIQRASAGWETLMMLCFRHAKGVCVCARVMIKCAPKMELFLIKTYSSTVQSNVCVLARTRGHKKGKGGLFLLPHVMQMEMLSLPLRCFQYNAVVEQRQLCRCNQRKCSAAVGLCIQLESVIVGTAQ